jgi:hypothetical protein
MLPGVSAAMPGFAKLSAQQWKMLVDLVRGASWTTSRRDGLTESERVSRVRAESSLIRRGLIVRCCVDGKPKLCLAVPPRTVLNAADDLEPRGVGLHLLRWYVEEAERDEARQRTWEARRQRLAEHRRCLHQHQEIAQLGAVASAVKLMRQRGCAEEDLANRVADLLDIYSRATVEECLAALRTSGAYARILREAQEESEPLP